MQLLPLMAERNPRVVKALLRLAEASGDLREWTRRRSQKPPDRLRDAPLEVRFQSWARAWRAAQPNASARFSRRHFDLAEAWLNKGGHRLQLPGEVFVRRGPTELVFEKIGEPGEPPSEELLDLAGPGPWLIELPSWGLDLRVELCPEAQPPQPWRADLVKPEGPWRIRGRRPGDRFGTHKLKKYLTQWGLSAQDKSRLPLLCDAQDQPFWAVGQRVRPEFLAPLGQPGWRFHFTPQGRTGRESNLI
jgi:tRNA(Ile)-lysidine synthetase-like protein